MLLVLATSNPGKLKEFQELLAPLDMEVVPQSQFTTVSAEESGLSFVENAIIKARHAARAEGLPAIADDAGIEVDALRGAPGIYSARFAGAGATDEANLRKLLHELRDVDAARRKALSLRTCVHALGDRSRATCLPGELGRTHHRHAARRRWFWLRSDLRGGTRCNSR